MRAYVDLIDVYVDVGIDIDIDIDATFFNNETTRQLLFFLFFFFLIGYRRRRNALYMIYDTRTYDGLLLARSRVRRVTV